MGGRGRATELIEPLLPKAERRFHNPGRKRLDTARRRRRRHSVGRHHDRWQPARCHPTIPLIEAIPPVYRDLVRTKGIQPQFARRGTEHGSGPGIYRWFVEQAFALLRWFRRLCIRWEIRNDIHEAFLSIACSVILLAPTQVKLNLLGLLEDLSVFECAVVWASSMVLGQRLASSRAFTLPHNISIVLRSWA